MLKPRKECGSCQFWIKWKDDGRGLCELLDAAGKAEHGKNCKSWKGRKYDRVKHKLDGSEGVIND